MSVIALAAAGVLVFSRRLPPEVPVFYSNPWGKDQLAPPYFLALPILLSFGFLVLNIFLSRKIFFDSSFLKNLLGIATGLLLFLSGITVLRIIILIT